MKEMKLPRREQKLTYSDRPVSTKQKQPNFKQPRFKWTNFKGDGAEASLRAAAVGQVIHSLAIKFSTKPVAVHRWGREYRLQQISA